MGFGQAISTVFSKYATFRGRARRSEYWYFFLFSILVGMVSGVIDSAVFHSSYPIQPITNLLSLALFLPSLAVTVRRMHDTGWSGWWLGGFYIFAVIAVAVIFSALGSYTTHAMSDTTFGAICLLFGLITIGYGIWLFVLMVLDGHRGPNQYGPDPKGPDTEVFS